MWTRTLGFHPNQFSPQRKCSKLITIYVLVLLISLSCTADHGRSFNHQIGKRSTPDNTVSFVMCSIGKTTEGPEIDPFWYVGRGVRPIGRFGKRHLKSGWNSLRSGSSSSSSSSSSLDLILNALQEREALVLDDDGL